MEGVGAESTNRATIEKPTRNVMADPSLIGGGPKHN